MQKFSRLFILGTLALSACSRRAANDPETLVFGLESEIRDMDPRKAFDLNSSHVSRLFSQGLIRLNEKMLPEPEAAETFDVKEARVFTFKLRKDLKFHNGQPLTSADVKWCFDDARDKNSLVKSAFEEIESLETPDPYTFVLKLKRPNASFLLGNILAIRILPKELPLKEGFGQNPIGSGPYRFVKRDGRDLHFDRFEDFRATWPDGQQHLPTFKRVIVRTVADPATRLLSLKKGDLDAVFNGLPAHMVKEASADQKLKVQKSPGNNVHYLAFNHRLKKFQDPRVRRALALALDRAAIVQHKLLGYAVPAESLLSPLNYYYNAKLPATPYNPAEAKRLLAEAGASKLEFELKTSTDPDGAAQALLYKSMWEAVGIKVTLRSLEWATFYDDVKKGNFEMHPLRWSLVTEPDMYYAAFHSKEVPPGRNRGYYSNKKLDRLADAGRTQADSAKRKKIYDEIQELAAKDLPYIMLWYPDNVVVTSAKLENFTPHPVGFWNPILWAKKAP